MRISLAMVEEIKALPTHEERVFHAALMYVREGIPILPVEANGKALPQGTGINYQSASTRVETVKKWFDRGGKFYGCNVGIATGMVGGVFALDVDAGDKNGFEAYTQMVEKYGTPEGPTARTPSGGIHKLFKWCENARSSTSKIAVGIDTRGGSANKCTGHVVAFPSVTPSGMYMWEEGGEVGDSPDWILDSLGEGWSRDTGAVDKEQSIPDQIIPAAQIERMLSMVEIEELEYDDWIRIGMAIKAQEPTEIGLQLWDEWSKKGSRYHRNECKIRWSGFAGDSGPVKAGTLFFFAKKFGWKPVPGDVLPSSGSNERVEEIVAEMNARYSIVSIAGSAKVIWKTDKRGMTREEKMKDRTAGYQISNRSDIELFESNNKVTLLVGDKVKMVTKFEVWMSHPARREYMNGIGCYPNGKAPISTYNVWEGFAVEPMDRPIPKFLNHVRDVICGGDRAIYEWVIDWMADMVQDPENPKGSAIVVKGIEGSGKGTMFRILGALFGRHAIQLTDSSHLFNKFNSLMEGCIFLYADEVVWGGNKQDGNKLKGLITEPTLQIEHKGVTSYNTRNLIHLGITSNESWVIPAGPQSRRYLVLECSPHVANNRPYFKQIYDEMDNGGYEGLLYMLLTRKITHNLSFAPVTKALKMQRSIEALNNCPIAQWLVQCVSTESFRSPDVRTEVGQEIKWPLYVTVNDIVNEFQEWEMEKRVRYSMPTNLFMQWLESVGFKKVRTTGPGKARIRAVEIPTPQILKSNLGEIKGIYFDDDDFEDVEIETGDL